MNTNRKKMPKSPQLKIGLTGGIASGKSAVSRCFASLGVPIIDADKIAKNLLLKGAPLLKALKQRFGNDIFTESDELDRKKLGAIVFNSPDDLEWLNQLTHPLVRKEIQSQLDQVDDDYVIIDVPLLVDKNGKIPSYLRRLIDRVLVVSISNELQRERLCSRDQITQEQANSIISNQSTLAQKLQHADDIVDNNGSFEQLESQVTKLHNQYLELSRARNRRDNASRK